MKLPGFAPIDGESLYSLITRHFWLSGHYDYQDYLLAVFGNSRHRIHPYLPSGIEAVARFLELPAQELLCKHTLFPMFAMTMTSQNSLKLAMLSVTGNPISVSHLPNFKLSFFKGHKYCHACVERDMDTIGCGVWYIEHQIPGVSVCMEHKCKLTGVSNQDYAIDRQLLLPRIKSKKVVAPNAECNFAQYSHTFFNLLQKGYDLKLKELYLQKLNDRGFVSNNRSLRFTMIVKELDAYWKGMEFGTELGLPLALQSWAFVGPLLRNKTGYPTHVIKHLLFSAWLFDGEAEKLFHQVLLTTPTVIGLCEDDTDNVDTEIITLLLSGKSMGEVRCRTRKSQCYIKRVADLNEISYSTNSNRYSNKIRSKVLVQAILGPHRGLIASGLGVSVGYVEQAISNTKGLSAFRRNLRRFKKIRVAEQVLIKSREKHPDWLRKDIKQQHNQAFFYLYQNARELLESLLPKKTKPKLKKYDWSVEDDRLYEAISKLDMKRKMSLAAIGRSINDRGHLIKKMHLLPKTKAILIRKRIIKQ
jgi:hypothetical protein